MAVLLGSPVSPVSGGSLASVLTQHNDNARTGANLNETILNTADVNAAQFGKLFARQVDGQIYAQPLLAPGLAMPGGPRDVVFVASMHDSVYAFDADDPAAATPLWQVSLGLSAPITYTLPNSTTIGHDFGTPNYFDISVEVGVVSTPVIDLNTNTLYVLAFTREPNPPVCPCQYAHRLHALDLLTGAEKFGGPAVISATLPGDADDGAGGQVTFQSKQELQRAGLLLQAGVVYAAFASYGDQLPYHGWVLGYNAATLQPVSAWNSTPNTSGGGIWQSGQGLVSDNQDSLYLTTGNGGFAQGSGDYGDSFVKLDPQGVVSGVLPVADSFTPYDQAYLNAVDLDFGSVGPVIIPGANLLLGGGKLGKLYMLDAGDMGGYQQGPSGGDRVVQSFQATDFITLSGHIHGSPVFWPNPSNPKFYIWGEGQALREYSLTIHSPVSATIQTTPVATGTTTLTDPFLQGGFLSLSANGSLASTGIVWAAHPVPFPGQSPQGVLRAYDAGDISHELWNSTLAPLRDSVGNFAKFNPPTIANGRVYLATFSKQLLVYGIMGAPFFLAHPLSQNGLSGQTVTLSAVVSGQALLHYQWYQGTSGDSTRPVGANSASFTTPPLAGTARYWVRASNGLGSADSATAVITLTTSLYLPLLNR